MNLLPASQVVVLGPQLGLCIAMATSDGSVVGHLYQGSGFEPPPADLRTYVAGSDGQFVDVVALTANGAAFLYLIQEVV